MMRTIIFFGLLSSLVCSNAFAGLDSRLDINAICDGDIGCSSDLVLIEHDEGYLNSYNSDARIAAMNRIKEVARNSTYQEVKLIVLEDIEAQMESWLPSIRAEAIHVVTYIFLTTQDEAVQMKIVAMLESPTHSSIGNIRMLALNALGDMAVDGVSEKVDQTAIQLIKNCEKSKHALTRDFAEGILKNIAARTGK